MFASWTISLIACVAALVLTPIAAQVATSNGWVDRPDVRKVHSRPVPYLGGVAVIGGFLIGCAALWWAADESARAALATWPALAILVGTLVMFVVGFIDDTRKLRARKKLVAQVVAALIVIASGVSLDGLQLTESLRLEFGMFGPAVTLVWIVGVTNAINIIDGLDGLCSSLSAVACAAIGWTALQVGNAPAAALMFVLLGAILGFLPYNFHPARIFLGDAGSLTLGFLLSTSAVLVSTHSPLPAAWGIPLVALGIPILDTLFSMVRRTLERRSIMSPDKNHLHHRFVALGFGHVRTALALAGLSAVGAALAAAVMPFEPSATWVVPVAALALYGLVFRLTGSLRFHESWRAVERIAANVRDANDERQHLDALELRLAEARSAQEWWSALSAIAASLGFGRLELELGRRDGGATRLEWTAVEFDPAMRRAQVELPIRDRRGKGSVMLRAAVPVFDDVAQTGRQLAAFTKAVQRHGLEQLPTVAPGEGELRRRRVTAEHTEVRTA